MLGAVHRDVGALEQLVGPRQLATAHAHADADARGHVDLGAREADRLAQRLAQPAGEGDRRALGLQGVEIGHQDEELVTGLAGHEVGFARPRHQPARHLAQQLVADRVPEAVVYELEVVEVEVQEGHAGARPARPRKRELEVVKEARAVGKAREHVVVGELLELLLQVLAVADVEDRTVEIGHLVLVVEHGLALLVDPARLPVGAHHAVLEHEWLAPLDAGVDLLLDQGAVVLVDHAGVRARVVADELFRGVAGDPFDLAAHELHLPVACVRAAIDRARHVGNQGFEPLLIPHSMGIGAWADFFRAAGRRQPPQPPARPAPRARAAGPPR